MPNLRQSGQAPQTRGGARSGEEGFILIAVLFLVALLLIGLAVAAPRMARSIQRDKEIELVHRGEQYRRAIQLYYRKFGAYPTSIDQLLDTNNIRFLRKRYTDPITGKDDWRLIHLGQAKVPPMGFFGQPLAGIPAAAPIGTPVSGATGMTAGGTSAFGQSSFGQSSFGSPASASPFGSATPGQNSDSSDSDSTSDSAANNSSATGVGGSPTPSPAPTSPGTSAASPFGSTSATSPTLGAGPIVGVGIPSTKASLLDYKKQTRYNKWEFVYNPIEDQMKQAAGMLGAGQGVNGTSNGTNSNSPFSNSNSGAFGNSGSSSTFGSSNSPFSSGTGNSAGTTPTSPPASTPQQ